MFIISAVLIAASGAALCIACGTGLRESIEQTVGTAAARLESAPRLGETLDAKTAATVIAAADIVMDISSVPRRFGFAVMLRGIFALPVG